MGRKYVVSNVIRGVEMGSWVLYQYKDWSSRYGDIHDMVGLVVRPWYQCKDCYYVKYVVSNVIRGVESDHRYCNNTKTGLPGMGISMIWLAWS